MAAPGEGRVPFPDWLFPLVLMLLLAALALALARGPAAGRPGHRAAADRGPRRGDRDRPRPALPAGQGPRAGRWRPCGCGAAAPVLALGLPAEQPTREPLLDALSRPHRATTRATGWPTSSTGRSRRPTRELDAPHQTSCCTSCEQVTRGEENR